MVEADVLYLKRGRICPKGNFFGKGRGTGKTGKGKSEGKSTGK